MKSIKAETIARRIRFPLINWPGNCHYVAKLILDFNIVKGQLCYGLWHGLIADGNSFSGRLFTHHGWIELENGQIYDPTRWVFESALPYIYIGPNNGEYDFGGNKLREKMQPSCPPFLNNETQFNYSGLSKRTKVKIAELVPSIPDVLCLSQLFWLANYPPDYFVAEAKAIYTWIVKQGQRALIPYDNKQRILG